jgi:hypothetical protein
MPVSPTGPVDESAKGLVSFAASSGRYATTFRAPDHTSHQTLTTVKYYIGDAMQCAETRIVPKAHPTITEIFHGRW